jgi:hypothetical protein
MSTLYYDSCGLCDLQTVGFARKGHNNMDGRRKRQLFHDPCVRCDDLPHEDDVALCNRCQHLRIPHIFGCMFESRWIGITDFFVAFDLSREQGENCAFCLFLASCAEKLVRSGDASVRSNVIVGMKSFTRGRIHEHHIRIFGRNENMDQSIIWFPSPGRGAVLYGPFSRGNPQHVQPYLNWSWACGWITDIQRRQDCGNKFFNMPSLSQKLHNLLVIDVIHRCIVDLPLGAKYLALSYVWGAIPEGGLQCTTANRKLLEETGSLGDITATLPRTISDAIVVCAKLGYKFLWVDRLCIMQDHPQISVQLDQMAAIYHQAALTIIAMEGDDATHGLPGVSIPRKPDQRAFSYADNFELVYEIPSLYSCRERSTWNTRGWTHQEYMASSVLVYFTNFGLYIEYWRKGEGNHVTEAEGPARGDMRYGESETSGLHLIQDYSGRTLTHRRDKLRGISGIHQAMYEGQITFGIPLNDFEYGIAWRINDYSKVREPRLSGPFPTWSWASVNERVSFPIDFMEKHCSLAYWGWAEESKTMGRTSFRWRPVRVKDHNEMYATNIQWSSSLRVSVALAWSNRCLYNEIPKFLSVSCSAKDWHKRVTARWPGRDRPYLPQHLQNDEQWRLLSTPEANALCASGRIIANTSKSTFKVDWNSVSMPGPDGQYGIVRADDGRLAGSVFLDDPSTDRFMEQEETSAEFIALAIISDRRSMTHYASESPMNSVPTGIIYGCPCCNNTAEAQRSDHIPECDKSSSFTLASFEQERSDESAFYQFQEITFDKLTTHEWAYFQHCKGVSFRDQAGDYLNSLSNIPEIQVLMIAPGSSSSDKGQVYRRLGIGRIFLKRWIESSPVFDTIVLE